MWTGRGSIASDILVCRSNPPGCERLGGNAPLNRPIYGAPSGGIDGSRHGGTEGRRTATELDVSPDGKRSAADGGRRPDAPTTINRAARAPQARPARGRKRGGRGGGRSLLRRMVYWCLVLALWGVVAAGGTLAYVASTLPPIQDLEIPKRPPKIEIVGLDGRPLAVRGEMSGTDVPIKELPPYLPKAFVAIEDRRFYSHLRHRSDRAGARRGGERAASRRIAGRLDHHAAARQEPVPHPGPHALAQDAGGGARASGWSANSARTEILELYLNRVYFGAGAYGVEAAAQRYFGKPAKQVKIAEAAMLAGLVKSPSRLAPSRNPNGAERRAQVVLAAMVGCGLRHRDHGEDRAGRAGARGQAGGRRLGQLHRRLDHGRARRSGRPRRAGPGDRDLDRSRPAGGRRKGRGRRTRPQGREVRRAAGRAGRDDAGRRDPRTGRRQELRRKPVQPRGRRQAPAGLGVQAVRLSDRARARADARYACARTSRSRSRAGSRKTTAANITAR